jgi:hypothetical protein
LFAYIVGLRARIAGGDEPRAGGAHCVDLQGNAVGRVDDVLNPGRQARVLGHLRGEMLEPSGAGVAFFLLSFGLAWPFGRFGVHRGGTLVLGTRPA